MIECAVFRQAASPITQFWSSPDSASQAQTEWVCSYWSSISPLASSSLWVFYSPSPRALSALDLPSNSVHTAPKALPSNVPSAPSPLLRTSPSARPVTTPSSSPTAARSPRLFPSSQSWTIALIFWYRTHASLAALLSPSSPGFAPYSAFSSEWYSHVSAPPSSLQSGYRDLSSAASWRPALVFQSHFLPSLLSLLSRVCSNSAT